jgi:two-component system chemotaxis response regulator CheY
VAQTILVIDDDPYSRMTLQLVLEDAGYAVVCAEDGAIGLRAFAARSPDLVITDMIMPEREGLETIGEIRKLDKAVPIIAVSGGGRLKATDILVLAENLGADGVLAKPFEADELVGKVRRHLHAPP